jgi:SAM-dependent methyltransferase
MASMNIKDDRGYNQGYALTKSTTVRMGRRADLLLSEMRVTPDTRILEIGCGTGEVSYWMASRSLAHVVGTDLCVPFIEEAKNKYVLPNLRYEVMDFNNPESFNGQFDYIVGNGILHHLYHHLDEALASMKRLLKDEGKIIFLEPNLHNPYVYFIFSYPWLRAKANLEPDEMAFSKRFIQKKLAQAGFTDGVVDYKDFLLPGIPAFFIGPSIWVGAILEKLPLTKQVAQSLFIRACKPGPGKTEHKA